MPKPTEAYRQGYERGKSDSLGERMAEGTMGMLRDDPGGYLQKGYSDGAAGRKFNPPPEQVRPPAADVNPFDDKVAIKTVCPNCGAVDWFEWKFLGKLKDPVCGHSWFAGSGTYALMQLRAMFAAAGKGAKYMNAGINFEGTQIFLKPIGWFCGAIFGVVFRLPFGLLMIPIQALAAVTKARTGPEIATRIVAFALGAAAFGFFVYTIESQNRQRFQPVQPAVFNPIQTSAPAPQTASTGSAPLTYPNSVVRPSFDCGKARTPVELLICRDRNLASLESEMASTFRQTLSRLPLDGQMVLRRNHLAWFKNYSRTCNQSPNDAERATCISNYLSRHTSELRTAATLRQPPVTNGGSVNLDLHCRIHGFTQGTRNLDGTGYGWRCEPNDANLSVDQACQEQYGSNYSARLRTSPPGGMNDWYCAPR